MVDFTKLKDFDVNKIDEILLSVGYVDNHSPSSNFKDGRFDILKEPLIPENLNIYVERNDNSLETIIILIPSLKNYGRFVSHGLDDLLIKFLKKYYDSIVTLHIDKHKKQTFKKKMESTFGINSNNKALFSRRNIENQSSILRTISSVQENKQTKALQNFFSPNNESSNPTVVGNRSSNPTVVGNRSSNPTLVGNRSSNPTVVGNNSSAALNELQETIKRSPQRSSKRTVNNISTSELDELLRKFQIANTVKPKTATPKSKKKVRNTAQKQNSKKKKGKKGKKGKKK